jgi:hypothetical protein
MVNHPNRNKHAHMWAEGPALELLFEQLTKRFGRRKTWESTEAPGRGRDAEFDRFCQTIAEAVSAEGEQAVKIQIRMTAWGVERQSIISSSQRVRAIYWALHAGFIGEAELTKILA